MAEPTALNATIPASTPFVGPERLMREHGLASLVRLGANESAFGPSPHALAAMRAAAEEVWQYGDPDAFALREALMCRHGCAFEEICIGSGIDDLMGLTVRAFLPEGGLALASRGTYPTFAYHVRGYGGHLEEVPYRSDGTPDLDALARAAARLRPRVLYLANPDNPSGAFVPLAEIERFRATLPEQTLLLLDEAYADFVPHGDLPAFAPDDGVVRTRTFSKAYGMAGARIGYAITSRRIVAAFEKVRLQYGVNRIAQAGALASLDDEDHLRAVVAETARGREEYAALARDLGIRALPSHTNFVCIDCGSVGAAEDVLRALLRRGIWIRKPAAPPLDRCVRVTVGTAAQRAAFAQGMRAVFAELPV